MKTGLIRKVLDSQSVRRVVRALHLRKAARRLYFVLFKPRGRIRNLSFQGIQARFHVDDFEGLKTFDAVFDPDDKDEGRILGPLLETLREGDVALDVGAHFGVHSTFMARKVGPGGTVVSVEPDGANFEMLERNIRLNRLQNVRLFRVALGLERASGRLFIDRKVGRGGISLLPAAGREFRHTVDIVPGDWLFSEQRLPLPRVVKVDVEGFEYRVLLGLRDVLGSGAVRLVCCEIHPDLVPEERQPEMIIGFLRSAGFPSVREYRRGSEIHAVFSRG